MKEFRLLPMLMLACTALLALKLLGLVQTPNSTWQQIAGMGTLFAQDAESASREMGTAPNTGVGATRTELSILQSLRNRREELAAREESLQLRENLIAAAEDRLESRISQLEVLEARLQAAADAELDARKEELQGLVTMYETMKAKEAARIFDRLPMDVLLDVVNAMNPRKMASVMAKMSPESAQRLTGELARSGRRTKESGLNQLPKIGG
ncbi:MAG: hypothetical protein COA52_10460 [Hyphomicrobiales bacterium]|nr:hypothetical protein [Hyphomicrobiales bacterium]PCJ90334.1 MAG: hypothetical protein COA52_10460 [Hyphomicrobiales bacterium]